LENASATKDPFGIFGTNDDPNDILGSSTMQNPFPPTIDTLFEKPPTDSEKYAENLNSDPFGIPEISPKSENPTESLDTIVNDSTENPEEIPKNEQPKVEGKPGILNMIGKFFFSSDFFPKLEGT